MLPIERHDPTDPIDSVEPTLPIESTEPAEPIERNDPLEAIERAERELATLRQDDRELVMDVIVAGGARRVEPGWHPEPVSSDVPRTARGWAPHVPAVLAALALLLGLQLLGTLLVDLTHLPVPGAVVGLVVLLAAGARFPGLAARAEPAGEPLLKHLQLLFIPPGVGALTQVSAIVDAAGPLALAVGGSFALGLVVAGVLLQNLLRRRGSV